MYIEEDYDHFPSLRINLRENELLHVWITHLPVLEMCDAYQLNPEYMLSWKGHLLEKIIDPLNHGLGIGQSIHRESLSAFSRWMMSTRNKSLFKSVPLSQIMATDFERLMIMQDVNCINCDSSEPAFVYYGTETSNHPFHTLYTRILKALDKPIFEAYVDLAACPNCNDEMYVTPYMESYARQKPRLCRCMPCGRGL